MTSEVRRDAFPRSSQCGGGEVAEPTAPGVPRVGGEHLESAMSRLELLVGLRLPLRELGVGEELPLAELRRPLERRR